MALPRNIPAAAKTVGRQNFVINRGLSATKAEPMATKSTITKDVISDFTEKTLRQHSAIAIKVTESLIRLELRRLIPRKISSLCNGESLRKLASVNIGNS